MKDQVTEEKIKEITRRIVQKFRPEKIVLFGSRARGDYSPESDLDLLVVQKSDLPRYRRAASIRRAIAGLVPSKDVIVFTPDEVTEWADVPNAFVTTALLEGRVLYEKNES